ncbi:DUF4123 domain-containing protein [Pseudomonas aeruginosa]|uniref:DUF4123 domain-containing protein n=1 Tax=Pseudomonas aeruginosa TaxID=287 RepID=UPI0015592315|nr:DUF4123 domain-containing protein [Pseudomonas aeruginosa]NPW33427.1 DUF4123 domain-containing protein [Pseudomonas aeruginosa]
MGMQNWLAARCIAPVSPEINVYCLCELSAHSELRARLEFHGVAYRSLWQLEAHDQLQKHAPCLFRSPPGDAFDEWLGGILDELPLSLVLTRLSDDGIRGHLRRFTKFQDRDGRYLLRLGDPVSLRLYLDSIAGTAATVAKLFGKRGVEAFYLHAPRAALTRYVQPLFEQGWDSPGREGYLVWRETDTSMEVS